MVFQVFIALVFLVSALGLYFVPRNRHIGFRTKHTLKSDKVWAMTNRLAAVLFAFSGAVFLFFSGRGMSNKDFSNWVFVCIIITVFICMPLSIVWAKRSDVRECKSQPKTVGGNTKKRKKKELFFSAKRRMSLFYSLFCGFLTAVSYIWLLQCLAFMPEDMAVYNHLGERIALNIDFETYSFATKFSFFAIIIGSALVFIVAANYYKLKPINPLPYSLKVSLGNMVLAYASTFALLLATINYAFLRSMATSRAGADEVFTMLLPLLGIILVWFALFKLNARQGG